MKKLLSLLSVLTISGSAVPTTIAASPYQKEEINNNIISQTNNLENLIRNKREKNSFNEIERYISWNVGNNIITFTPDFWEEVIILHENNFSEFSKKFKDKVVNNVSIPIERNSWKNWVKTMEDLGKFISDNWNDINNKWQNSNRKKRIQIYFNDYKEITHSGGWSDITEIQKTKYYDTIIKNDDTIDYSNKYLNKLRKDYGTESYYCYNCNFNLGLIDNEYNSTILQRIKLFHPNLDITQIEVINKIGYSYFSKGFSTKIKVKNNSLIYSPGYVINHNFVFNTKVNLNKINDRIKNDLKVITWINHLKEWNNDVDQELKTSVPQKTYNEKIEWKNRKKEDLKKYIRDWSYILNLIENELKLEELYNTVQGIKQEINNLKEKINNLQDRLEILEKNNKSAENCVKYGGLISATTGWIPVVGTLISTISGTLSAMCDIANS